MELDIDPKNLCVPRDRDLAFLNQCGLSKEGLGIVKKYFVKEIKEYFLKIVNPLVARDFHGGLKIRFKNGTIDVGSESKFKQYIDEMRKMNVWTEFKSKLSYTRSILQTAKSSCEDIVNKFEDGANDWYKKFLKTWDE